MKGRSGQKVQNESPFFWLLKAQSLIILIFQMQRVISVLQEYASLFKSFVFMLVPSSTHI